jgi:hypothetical protein
MWLPNWKQQNGTTQQLLMPDSGTRAPSVAVRFHRPVACHKENDQGNLFQLAAPDAKSNPAKRRKPMSADSPEIGPISIIPLDLDRSSGDHEQEPAALEWPGAIECRWYPAAAERAAECAAEMRKRIAEKIQNWTSATTFPGEACLAPPLLDRDLGWFPSEVLLSWVHFTPYRPIVSHLWYVELPEATEGLLTFFKEDPFQKQNAVFALIPGAFDETKIAQAATALFAINGHESCVLVKSLPTSVGHRENWSAETTAPMFAAKLAKELFRFPAVRRWPMTDMRTFCDHLRRFPDPWERATAGNEYLDRVATGTQTPQMTEFSERGFDEWFDLVTDPVHVEGERRNFQTAFDGALRMRERWRFEQAQQPGPHDQIEIAP